MTGDNGLPIQHDGVIETGPRNDVLEGLDGGRPKMNEKWRPILDASAVEYQRGDTKKKPGVPSKVPLLSSGSW